MNQMLPVAAHLPRQKSASQGLSWKVNPGTGHTFTESGKRRRIAVAMR
jgi:hypothetical protein